MILPRSNKMKIKMIVFHITMAFFLTIAVKLDAQTIDICSEDTSINIVNGEELVYKIYYKLGFLWIPTGEVIFKSKEIDDYFILQAEGKTYSSYDVIFTVRDYFYSKIDKNTLQPVEFIRKVHEGNYKKYHKTEFDYDKNLAISEVGKTKSDTRTVQCSIEKFCTQDVLSILYRLRSINFNDLSEGDIFNLDVFIDNKVYDINLLYDGQTKQKKIKNLGYFDTNLLFPETISGNVFDKDDGMKIWVSTDSNRIPLLIESPISVGSIKAVLKSYKGLATTLE